MNAGNGFRSSARQGAILSPLVVLAVLGLSLSSCGREGLVTGSAKEEAEYRTSLTRDGRGIARRPAPMPGKPAGRFELPVFDPSNKDPFRMDVRGRDLRGLDLENRSGDLLMCNFDLSTRWPSRLPAGFDPALIMEYGKDPGLGVRALHQGGIDGRGVGIAVIDQALLVDHAEYRDRLRLYEEIHCYHKQATLHGAAVASIAAGTSVGVAPAAGLYFIGETSGDDLGTSEFEYDFRHLARAIERLLKVNKRLAEGERIRVIAIAQGWGEQQAGHDEATRAVAKARREGVFVVSSSLFEASGRRFAFGGLGREPVADPASFRSFGPGMFWAGAFFSGGLRPVRGTKALYVPMDARTAAGPRGPDDYAFYRQGGWSWAIPWIAGLYALACQVRPDVTPDLFWATALATGDSLEFPPRERPLTPEEVEARVPKLVEEVMARFRADLARLGEGADAEKSMAALYERATGVRRPRMSEADFRAWEAELARARLSAIGRPVELEKIVNPVRLISALRDGRLP